MEQPQVTCQSARRRIHNFQEVSLGYPQRIALREAQRCPQCLDPVCCQGCPLGIDIPGFIRFLREGNFSSALKKIKEQNPLPAICGRICPAPCETACILTEEKAPIGIRALERYAANFGREKFSLLRPKICRGKKVAVIGSGPMGLSAAAQLAKNDYQVTIFEAMDEPGGALRYGIPDFRLPKKILDEEIEAVKALGVHIQTNYFFQRREDLEGLFARGCEAVVLAIGMGVAKIAPLKGIQFAGVYLAEELLMRLNHYRPKRAMRDSFALNIGQRIAVLGFNHAALDCARVAVRLGRKATVIFPQLQEDMPVEKEEQSRALEEGVQLEPLTQPMEILSNERKFVNGVRCRHMDFIEGKRSGRWELAEVEGSDFIVEADTVILAAGQKSNFSVAHRLGLVTSEEGALFINRDNGMTSMPGIFADEFLSQGSGSVVEAIAAGKRVAARVDEYLKTESGKQTTGRGK